MATEPRDTEAIPDDERDALFDCAVRIGAKYDGEGSYTFPPMDTNEVIALMTGVPLPERYGQEWRAKFARTAGVRPCGYCDAPPGTAHSSSCPRGVAAHPAPEPCPRGTDKPEPTCTNRHQCWEPCGELGHSEEHARVGRTDPAEVDRLLGIERGNAGVGSCGEVKP